MLFYELGDSDPARLTSMVRTRSWLFRMRLSQRGLLPDRHRKARSGAGGLDHGVQALGKRGDDVRAKAAADLGLCDGFAKNARAAAVSLGGMVVPFAAAAARRRWAEQRTGTPVDYFSRRVLLYQRSVETTRHPGAGRDPALANSVAERRLFSEVLGPGLRRDDESVHPAVVITWSGPPSARSSRPTARVDPTGFTAWWQARCTGYTGRLTAPDWSRKP